MLESKVYILGAGCSKHCGYPLGPEMKEDLERFGRSLDPATSPRLRKAVADTLALFGTTTETIDVLVQKLYGGNLDQEIGGERHRHQRALFAALSTSASFLAKEVSARQTGFGRYREFVSDLFQGAQNRWDWMPQPTHCHVLTFNYDRLFEIAFLDRFKIEPYGLYSTRVLNSGVTIVGVEIEFTPEAFSFLKLHGSVAGWSVDIAGTGHPKHQRCIFETPDPSKSITISDDFFFAEPLGGQHPNRLKREPLLYFPYQRQIIVSSETGLRYDTYARAVWKRARELISNATEIHVIGYSFSGIDRAKS